MAELVSPNTARSYGSYWKKALAARPERRLDEITASDIKTMSEKVKATALVRSNSRAGRNAAENFIAAMRCLYRHAEADGTIDERRNPARRATKPRRNKSTRRALPDARIAELNEIVSTTGDNPELDALIVRLHEETACRRGGALTLRPRDLDRDQCLIYLREKDETTRWQPVSPTLMRHLLADAEERGTGHRDDQLLRYANGAPITRRRYDYIWTRPKSPPHSAPSPANPTHSHPRPDPECGCPHPSHPHHRRRPAITPTRTNSFAAHRGSQRPSRSPSPADRAPPDSP
ncbi:hypothetical protein GCM10022222_63930 [Amycolatopsis ultiminotia]|uniref:Core-binding (CB) domain-containing protein n=1 Tax=Amycolatopsis ultiminotia TaxID=543629 RepID=A0ABP6XRG7_9PSEU